MNTAQQFVEEMQRRDLGVKVVQHFMPGGGSEFMRWVSREEFAARQQRAERERRVAEMNSYSPYGPGAK